MSARKLPSLVSQLILSDYRSRPEAVLYAAFTQPQLEGSQPHVARRVVRTNVPLDLVDLVPCQMQVSRRVSSKSTEYLFAHDDRSSLLVEYSRVQAIEIYVCADEYERATELLGQILSQIPETTTPKDSVGVTVWNLDSRGPSQSLKSIRVPTWADIERNYPAAVTEPLSLLLATERPYDSGKLILWHGEPGTGKTTALRALIREWQDWCSIDYIADPERLFASTSYLLEVIGKAGLNTPRDSNASRWRLLIAEDSDEFLRVSARKEAGAALGRLLNVTDGILGQGSNMLILLTTNERVDRLHPAVIRPGRCIAQVEFTRFSPTEAGQWLPSGLARLSEPKTLAELIEYRDAAKQISTGIAPVANIGAYL